MSDDLTARIDEYLALPGASDAASDDLLAEARDEIARLRDERPKNRAFENTERDRLAWRARAWKAEAEVVRLREGIAAVADRYDDGAGTAVEVAPVILRAALDAPSTASPVRDGTNTEQDEP